MTEIVLGCLTLAFAGVSAALLRRALHADASARADADARMASIVDMVSTLREDYEERYARLFDRLAARDLPEQKKAELYEKRIGLEHERRLAEIEATGKRGEDMSRPAPEGIVVGLGMNADQDI